MTREGQREESFGSESFVTEEALVRYSVEYRSALYNKVRVDLCSTGTVNAGTITAVSSDKKRGDDSVLPIQSKRVKKNEQSPPFRYTETSCLGITNQTTVSSSVPSVYRPPQYFIHRQQEVITRDCRDEPATALQGSNHKSQGTRQDMFKSLMSNSRQNQKPYNQRNTNKSKSRSYSQQNNSCSSNSGINQVIGMGRWEKLTMDSSRSVNFAFGSSQNKQTSDGLSGEGVFHFTGGNAHRNVNAYLPPKKAESDANIARGRYQPHSGQSTSTNTHAPPWSHSSQAAGSSHGHTQGGRVESGTKDSDSSGYENSDFKKKFKAYHAKHDQH